MCFVFPENHHLPFLPLKGFTPCRRSSPSCCFGLWIAILRGAHSHARNPQNGTAAVDDGDGETMRVPVVADHPHISHMIILIGHMVLTCFNDSACVYRT